MKNIKIKYNPYLVTTEITVDGNKPKANSSLNVGNKRLQEWIEKHPDIIIEEYRDNSAVINFTGSKTDFEDIQAVLATTKDKFKAEANLNKTADISDVEKEIDCIFQEIQNGPVPELRDKLIVEAFQKAKDSKFEINVVATMSSGKSTLINALLGKQLMPAANEATTATIVKIVDTEQENFSAIAYDKSGNIVRKIDDVTLEDMKGLNGDIKVSTVELKGKIPFVSSVGMKLVLVDTPGPNNSRDKSHEEMTHKMISESEKSLVLYVMNGQQLGINDEKIFLDYVCQSMKEGGKQARERFIFAVNKMDAFKPKDEGVDCIERALNGVKVGLEERGIYTPNIFPVTACAALELRTDDDEPMALDNFRRSARKYNAMHFDNYYKFSNLPETVRTRISGLMDNANEDEIVEIHTGIISIEQAIAQYINKYARTTKVKDLVSAFNKNLKDLAAFSRLEKNIREDKEVKAVLEKQIAQIKNNIQSAQNAQTRSKSIDDIDLKPIIEAEVRKYIESVKNKINKLISGQSNKVEKSIAKQKCSQLEKECNSISIQIKIEIDKILNKAYKETINKIIEEYKKYLSELNIGVNSSALSFNPANLVSASLANMSSIIDANTETADESYTVRDSRTVRKEGGFLRQFASGFTFGLIKDHTWEKEFYNRKVAKYVDYVDMKEVAEDYIKPFQTHLQRVHKGAVEHVVSETERLKQHLKGELGKIDKVLNDKLDALTKTESDSKVKAAEIAQKENNLRWLESIQKRVNDIIEF